MTRPVATESVSVPPCLLCDSRFTRQVPTVTGRELRNLFSAAGRNLTDAAFGSITNDFSIILFECGSCGFQYFDPQLAGGGAFYGELEKASYYPPERPEFLDALSFCRERGLKRILDVGGGDGAFLDLARAAGFETVGIELSSTAAQIARAKGHRMLEKPLAETTADELGGGVEFMTFFQVVEHLPNPRLFLREAGALVVSGGYMMFSVPFRNGIFRLNPYDPTNLPPHHISRWRHEDLVRLSESCGLEVVRLGTDPLYGSGIEGFWKLHNKLAKAIRRRTYPGGDWLPKSISLLYRKLGARYFLPRMGMSISAIVRRR